MQLHEYEVIINTITSKNRLVVYIIFAISHSFDNVNYRLICFGVLFTNNILLVRLFRAYMEKILWGARGY